MFCFVAAVKQGVVGDRWRFPNYWYFTRHVFTNVPVDVENPYTVGRNIDEAYQLNNHKGKGEKGNVVVVTVYVDTMLLIADEQFDRGSPYLLSKDEIYHLQLEFIDAVLAEARRDADWIFICGHHPVVTDANMDRNIPGFAARMNELIKKYGVDVYVSGHEHMLSLFQDETGTEGTYIISGSASKRNVPVTCRRKSCLFNSAKPGFVLHLLSKTNLHHVFVDNNGEVLFTHTQHVKQRERVPEQINLLAYPPIRRVYIGPSEQSVGSARPRFAPHVYFLFGAMSAAACVLLLAVLLWLLGTFKRRKSAIVSAFMTRLQAPQTQQATSDDPKLCRDVLVVTGKVVQPRSLSDRQNNEPEHEHDRRAVQHQKLEQASAESASISRVLSKSKCSILQGTMRRSSILQPHIERKETPTSTSFEAQSLLGFSQPPRGYAGGWVRNDLPPSEKTAGRGDP